MTSAPRDEAPIPLRTIEREHWTLEEAGPGRLTVRLASFAHFETYLRTLDLFAPHFVWRGQASVQWPLLSSLDRLRERCGWAPDEKFTRDHLERFKAAARGRLPSGVTPSDPENEWWAIGRHFGLATPLLDWTHSPFVAAFFAYQEELRETEQFRCVYGLSRLWVRARKDDAATDRVEFVTPYSHDNARLIAQDALFTRAPEGRSIESCVESSCDATVRNVHLIRIELPDAERLSALLHLRMMNISHRTLFPDLSGSGATTNFEYELGPLQSTPGFYHTERYRLDDGSIESNLPPRVPPQPGVPDPLRSTFRAADPTPEVGKETTLTFTARAAFGTPLPGIPVKYAPPQIVSFPNPFAKHPR